MDCTIDSYNGVKREPNVWLFVNLLDAIVECTIDPSDAIYALS